MAALAPSFLGELLLVLRLGAPQSLQQVAMFVPRTIVLMVVGNLDDGDRLVAAAGLGTMYANFSGLMMLISTSLGATSVFSQAYGSGNHRRVGHLLLRLLAIQAVGIVGFSLPLTALATPILVAVGFPPDVVADTQAFLWVRLAAVPFMAITLSLTRFLVAQALPNLPMLVQLAGSVSQILLAPLLTARIGFLGAPLAMSLADAATGIALAAAARWLLSKRGLRSWPRCEWRSALSGWSEMLRLGVAASCMTVSEWLSWELNLFVAQGLCDAGTVCAAVEAFPIATVTMPIPFLVALGPNLAASSRVGNLLGEGRPADAKRCARTAWVIAICLALLLYVFCCSLRRPLAALFVDGARHAEIVEEATRLAVWTFAYAALATMGPGWSQQLLLGIGGSLRIPAIGNALCYLPIALPLAHFLAFDAGQGVRGLWMGLNCGMLLIVCYQHVMICRVDWARASADAIERSKNETSGVSRQPDREADNVRLASADGAAEQAAIGIAIGDSTRTIAISSTAKVAQGDAAPPK